MKRILLIAFSLLMMLTVLAGCNKNETPEVGYISLLENGASTYTVIYPDESKSGREAANLICRELQAVTGVSFKPTTDKRQAEEGELEILIGDTTRAASGEVKQTLEGNDTFKIAVHGKKIVLVAASDAALVRGAEYFAATHTTQLGCVSGKDALYIPTNLSHTASITFTGEEPATVFNPTSHAALNSSTAKEIAALEGFNKLGGGCSDGTHYYYALQNDSGVTRIAKVNIKSNELVLQSADLSLGAASDMCYNYFTGTLVVLHGGAEDGDTVSVLSAETLALQETAYLPMVASAIGYRGASNHYVIKHATSQKFAYLDYSFSMVGNEFSLPAPDGINVFEGLTADSTNIYALYTDAQGDNVTLMGYNTDMDRYTQESYPGSVTGEIAFLLHYNSAFAVGTRTGNGAGKLSRASCTLNEFLGQDDSPSAVFNEANTQLNTDGLTAEFFLDAWTAAHNVCPELPDVGVQGACTDGTYGYFCFEHQVGGYESYGTHEVRIAKINLKTKECVKVSKIYNLHHCNDATYNTKTNELIIAYHGDRKNEVAIFDPNTLEWKRDVTIINPEKPTYKYAIYSINYEPSRDCYIVGRSNNDHYAILDSNFKEVKSFKIVPVVESNNVKYTTQGMTCDKNYVYFTRWVGTDTIKRNYIEVYDWDGNYCFSKPIPDIEENPTNRLESENIWIIGKDIYVGYSAKPDPSINKPGDCVFKITISNWLQIPD